MACLELIDLQARALFWRVPRVTATVQNGAKTIGRKLNAGTRTKELVSQTNALAVVLRA